MFRNVTNMSTRLLLHIKIYVLALLENRKIVHHWKMQFFSLALVSFVPCHLH